MTSTNGIRVGSLDIPIHNNNRSFTPAQNGNAGKIQIVLILGSNRKTNTIIDSLRPAGVDIHQAVARHSHKTSESGVRVHKTEFNFSDESLSDLFSTVRTDLVISTIAGGQFETQQCIIDNAIRASIPRFMPAEFGHDSMNPKIQYRLPHHRERARVLEYLHDQASQDRISYLALATGTTLDQDLHSGRLGFDMQWQSATLQGPGDEIFAASSTQWLGRVVLAAIRLWDEVQNQYLYVSGLTTSPNEVLDALERETGEIWEAGRGEVGECVCEGEKRIASGFPDAGMFLLERSILYDPDLGAVDAFVKKDAKGQLGLKPELLEGIVKRALHQHGHHGKRGCGCD
ncbi:Hypothetical protein R9X50_00316600 [Acrodontium crateriforme]|uniref:NmrA-like domain-containing protein n=1 Tax=Acrodontium crateriforme TaxID=150365 RepID=A0AAQ3M5P2_9PEZI|nr:Hypothetical protein R9X50_00316600 [Acrodontium crateriforme]